MLRLTSLVVLFVSGQVICETSHNIGRQILPGIGSFSLNTTSVDWSTAEKHCRVDRMETLAFPHSEQEAILMSRLMKTYGVSVVHAGFHDMYKEGVYYTLTGSLARESCFQNWSSSPFSVSSNCGAFLVGPSKSHLEEGRCVSRYAFICVDYNYFKKDFDFLPGFGYYKLHRAQRVWIDAQQTCEADGAQLLVLNSHEEFKALSEEYGDVTVWVGVHQLFTNADFVTVFDESLNAIGFNQWQPGQPDGTNTQNPYVLVDLSLELTPGLAVSNATRVNSFICEYPLKRTTPNS